jgi:predicted TIM-barrel fold metal-dependent hydrolase
VYPTNFLGISSLPDHDFAEAQARAYNRWVAEYCSHSPKRLFGIAAIPQVDVQRAVKMLHEVRQLGLVGVFFRPNPSEDRRWFSDPLYDPLWATLQELDLTLGFHPFLAPDMPGAVRALGLNEYVAPGAQPNPSSSDPNAETYGMRNIFFSQALGNVFDMQLTLTWLICGGVLERFPKLRVALLEGNCAWAPWLLHRLDEHYEWVGWHEAKDLTMRPSEYFKRNCFLSIEADEEPGRQYIEWFGDANLVFSTDYPHGDSKFPHAVDYFAKLPISEESQRRIVGENWSRLYGIPLAKRAPRS